MKRIEVFAKGNVDVHDSLHSCRIGGEIVWNGINEIFRGAGRDVSVRVRHETWTRSDALLAAGGVIPDALRTRSLPLGSYPAQSQFSRALFETKADAIVLSIQPDVSTRLLRHRGDGFLLSTDGAGWSRDDLDWLREEFEPVEPLAAAASMANLASVVASIQERSETPILIYNMSPVAPGETIHSYAGLGETYATRIKRFNLGLIELSEATGISIVDVDSLIARHGADTMKLDVVHLTPAGYRLVAAEVVRILDDLGLLEG